jgi:hypothetical protein
MKKLIVRIGIICVAFVVLDLTVGNFLYMLLKNSPDGRYYKTRYTLEESEEDVLILGSSRAEGNYSPLVMEESLEMKVWNAGRGGQGVPFWYAMNQGVLARHTPKIVVINVENDFLKFDPNDKSYERAAGMLRPFYKRHEPVQGIVDLTSKAERYLLYSNFYAFNSSFYYMLRPFFFKGVDGKVEDKGWKPQYGKMDGSKVPPRVINENGEFDQMKADMFSDFVTDLKKKGSKVFIAVSPDYNKRVEHTPSLDFVSSLDGVYMLDFSNDTVFTKNPDFYIDPIHLNEDGAIEYSKKVAQEIRKVLSDLPDINLANNFKPRVN